METIKYLEDLIAKNDVEITEAVSIIKRRLASLNLSKRNQVKIYADGACSGNPGPGGWGVVIEDTIANKIYEFSGHDKQTTNNRMELSSAIFGLHNIINTKYTGNIEIVMDSQYVINGITKWITNWKRNNWKTSTRRPVINKDLWEKLDKLTSRHSITWTWTRGHAGHKYNEIADQLAVAAIKR